MQKAKETASNIAASAKAGMDKTKATVQEKVEKMTAHDQVEKEMATERKQDKINEAEWNKQETTRQHNAASRQAGSVGTGTAVGDLFDHSATGPTGHVPQGVSGTAHPIGTNTATGRTGNPNTGMGMGMGESLI